MGHNLPEMQDPKPLQPLLVGAISSKRLWEEPRTAAYDHTRKRLFLADGYGIFACRDRTLRDAECDLDCRCDGYADYAGHIRSVRSISVSRDGKHVASVSDLDKNLILHELDTYNGRGFAVARVYACEGTVLCTEFTRDSKSVMISLPDGKVRVFRIDDGVDERIPALEHDSRVLMLQAGEADGVQILTCVCADGSCWVWALDRIRILAVLRTHHHSEATGVDHTWNTHTAAIRNCALSPDGFQMLTSSKDSVCKIWKLPLALATSATHAKRLMGIGPAEFLARVQIAESLTGTKLELSHALEHSGACRECVFASDALIVTSSSDATCTGWCAVSGTRLFQISCIDGFPPKIIAAHRDSGTDMHRIYLFVVDALVAVEVCEKHVLTDEQATLLSSLSKKLCAKEFQSAETNVDLAGSRNRTTNNLSVSGDAVAGDTVKMAGNIVKMEGKECAWLLVERQRIIKHGFRLLEVCMHVCRVYVCMCVPVCVCMNLSVPSCFSFMYLLCVYAKSCGAKVDYHSV